MRLIKAPPALTDAIVHGADFATMLERPIQRSDNAMTRAMYHGLAAFCTPIDANMSVRVALLRGAGGKAFVAGTDIAQFREFAAGDDGIAYEARLDGFVDSLEHQRERSSRRRRLGRGLF